MSAATSVATKGATVRNKLILMAVSTTFVALLAAALAMLLFDLRAFQRYWTDDLMAQADIVQTVVDGKFAESDYNGDFRVGLQTGDNPFIQSAFGPMVSDDTEALIEEARTAFVGGGSPFAGPVTNQDGEVVWAEGEQPTYADVETMDFFVQGVTGSTG